MDAFGVFKIEKKELFLYSTTPCSFIKLFQSTANVNCTGKLSWELQKIVGKDHIGHFFQRADEKSWHRSRRCIEDNQLQLVIVEMEKRRGIRYFPAVL
jgi:hypothetical protein